MKPKLLQLISAKIRQISPKQQGFTLIELLVVITIIGILAGAAFPVVNGMMEKARRVKVLAVVKDLQVSIKSYQTEYNRYPGESGADSPINTTQDTNLVSVLLGNEGSGKVTNPRGIKFIDLPMAKNRVGGLVGTGGSSGYTLVDEWGQGFTVIMDTDYDNQIDNPDTSNSDPKISSGASPQLPTGSAVYSNGSDKKKSTKDDIVSWRSQ